MNLLLEDGTITEMGCGTNFAYILRDNADFSSTEYKVLHSQKDSCFAKCVKMLFNGRIQFYYMVNAYKPLADMLQGLDADSFMTIASNLLGNIIDVKNNGFLSCWNIDISLERIYVEPSTYKVKLIYLPASKRFFADIFSFENELRTELVRLISKRPELSTPKTTQFASDLSNGMLSLDELHHRIKGGAVNVLPYDDVLQNEQPAGGGSLKLVAMNMQDRVVVEVTKNEFIIGRNASMADGVVTFNKMIGRKHCKVIKTGSQYCIADLESTNGTYVNHARIQPNQPCPVKNGDIVRLANSDFQVVIQ